MLQRMNELAVQAANGTNESTDREYLDLEVQQLISEIDRVQSTTTFNEQNLLNGDFSGGKDLLVGSESGVTITLKIGKMGSTALSVNNVKVSTSALAKSAIASIKNGLKTLSKQRSELGAVQNRLEHTINNLNSTKFGTLFAQCLQSVLDRSDC